MSLDEATATDIAQRAVERVGGNRRVHGSPRHPFALNANREIEVDGYTVLIRYGEISSPAIVEVEGYIFEIRSDSLVKLFGP